MTSSFLPSFKPRIKQQQLQLQEKTQTAKKRMLKTLAKQTEETKVEILEEEKC